MTELTSVFNQDQPYYQLDPSRVMDAVEHLGFYCDGRIQALNSYENRVFQVGIEDAVPLIVKFYRPERWSEAQILEEHQFCQELVEAGLAVVAPMQLEGQSLFNFNGYRYALFPRKGGHAPELDNENHLFELGRFLGRLHQTSELRAFQHRPTLSVKDYGRVAQQQVLDSQLLQAYEKRYLKVTDQILAEVEQRFNACAAPLIRTQGDCHMGNMLWRDDALVLLDFDDCRMAPAMQDIWMLLTGDQQQQQRWLSEVVEGYEEYREFPARELQLVEPLRALRIVYYSGWLAQRRADPAFIQAFPQFGGEAWWSEHIRSLEQQLQQLSMPSLSLTQY
ncbi:Ser/Thr protein kinase RdoA involved in Cpx stress response, MazF antagonist [Oceanospirillum multiglobuliferum]|uniref:Stress response kinase A n=1 Tax=Oceanospirillum multiglobuliferum TaxID=64969 RepID=A0A1T4SAQ6_9GAMM|nr:serine/threonine protein kinase [Oceanospirillum multiglobuliferum]OPX54350.1 stress response serine/threonine protein kinase YihE [Oceanospirillum multiglobuliferum]SKA24931.1 Ser/Thr protein kinase RdoA involved in Cpx stress response, MazF antagonist [Oceanospirillum multiglobuliferum]